MAARVFHGTNISELAEAFEDDDTRTENRRAAEHERSVMSE